MPRAVLARRGVEGFPRRARPSGDRHPWGAVHWASCGDVSGPHSTSTVNLLGMPSLNDGPWCVPLRVSFLPPPGPLLGTPGNSLSARPSWVVRLARDRRWYTKNEFQDWYGTAWQGIWAVSQPYPGRDRMVHYCLLHRLRTLVSKVMLEKAIGGRGLPDSVLDEVKAFLLPTGGTVRFVGGTAAR